MADSPRSNRSREDKPVLRLDRSRTSRAFEPDESIWRDELSTMYRLLLSHSHILGRLQSEPTERQPILSLAIFGTYGSGKTSLLKTFIREVNTGGLGDEFRGMEGKIHALPDIEPDFLSSDDHFLYAFLATALEEDLKPKVKKRRVATQRYRTREGEWRTEHGAEIHEYWEDEEPEAEESRILSPVQRAFQEVSEYLRVIDNAQGRLSDRDPLGASLERLERHTSGLRLRRKMAKLIDALVDRLAGSDPSSLLLMPVDDPDLDQASLMSTMETYRRYLQHPRLVPVFTFNDRLSEELLRVRYEQKLGFEQEENRQEEIQEIQSLTKMTRSLAFQYLIKLFPVRNRIRLGPAAERIQNSQYEAHVGTSRPVKRDVEWLLRMASLLLFGETPKGKLWEREYAYALRPSTLRRQIQVVDAVYEAGVARLHALGWFGNDRSLTRWVHIFQKALWSLINVHRDALLEVDISVEDLYSWPPYSLRRVILGTMLSLDPHRRGRMLHRWRFKIESRRSQALSLLALDVFRPRLKGEGVGEEIEDEGEREEPPKHHGPSREPLEPGKYLAGKEMPAALGIKWFLDIWTGFYLPLVLIHRKDESVAATKRQSRDGNRRDRQKGHTLAVGWQLRTGANRALEEMLESGRLSAPGMMKLDPEEFSNTYGGWLKEMDEQFDLFKKLRKTIAELESLSGGDEAPSNGESNDRQKELNELKDKIEGAGWLENLLKRASNEAEASNEEEDSKHFRNILIENLDDEDFEAVRARLEDARAEFVEKELTTLFRTAYMIDTWCAYGHHGGRAWSAVSLWRGLGLLGRLIDLGFDNGEISEDLKKYKESRAGSADESGGGENDFIQKVRELVEYHSRLARVAGERGEADTVFTGWQLKSIEGDGRIEYPKKLADWLAAISDYEITPLHWRPGGGDGEAERTTFGELIERLHEKDEAREESGGWVEADPEQLWTSPLIGRLHGDRLIGDLNHRLETANSRPVHKDSEAINIQQDKGLQYTAWGIVDRWQKILKLYWRGKDRDSFVICSRRGDALGEGDGFDLRNRIGSQDQGEVDLWTLLSSCPLFDPWFGDNAEKLRESSPGDGNQPGEETDFTTLLVLKYFPQLRPDKEPPREKHAVVVEKPVEVLSASEDAGSDSDNDS